MASRCMSAINDVDTIARQLERRRQKVKYEAVYIFILFQANENVKQFQFIPGGHVSSFVFDPKY